MSYVKPLNFRFDFFKISLVDNSSAIQKIVILWLKPQYELIILHSCFIRFKLIMISIRPTLSHLYFKNYVGRIFSFVTQWHFLHVAFISIINVVINEFVCAVSIHWTGMTYPRFVVEQNRYRRMQKPFYHNLVVIAVPPKAI